MTQIKKMRRMSDGVQVYPQTHTKAVVDDNGYTAESRLQAMQDEINQAQMELGAVPSDLTPTENSSNWVTSGGVYNKCVLTNPQTVTEGSVDLEIVDINNNILARFANGHIETKEFNSANINTQINQNIVSRFSGKHIAIVGDSISTYSGYVPSGWRNYYTNTNLGSVENTYWKKVCSYLGMTYNNCSYSASRVSGNSTANSVTGAQNECAGCSDVRISALNRDGKSPDIILITLGTNDWGNKVPLGTFDDTSTLPNEGVINTFAPAYALMLYKMQTSYPSAQIFCCTILPRLSGDADGLSTPPCLNSDGVSLNSYNNKIKEIANIFGCNVIDLFSCGLSFVNIASYAVDNTLHPNANGHTLMANKIIAELKSKY